MYALIQFNIFLEVLSNTTQQKEKTIDIQIEKKEVKLSLFACGVIVYVENPKETAKKLLKQLSLVRLQDKRQLNKIPF